MDRVSARVIDLRAAAEARRRERRERVLDQAATVAPEHPSLRWVAGDTWYLAHRRDRDTRGASCGHPGPLVLAPPGTPPCPLCYPPPEPCTDCDA
jgi:hypothetical protein